MKKADVFHKRYLFYSIRY